MSRFFCYSLILLVAGCGIQRPLMKPKDIPAFEQKQQQRLDKRQRDMDDFERQQQEQQRQYEQLQQQSPQPDRQNFMLSPV